jgi:hypothetical protein
MKRPALIAALFSILLIAAICPKPTPTPPAPVYVTVNVCSASGLIAGAWCPADMVSAKTFVSGTQPTAVCNVHHAPPAKTRVAKPWVPGGELIAWSGMLYGDLAATFIDESKYDALCEAMAMDGIAVKRSFAYYSSKGDQWEGTGAFPWNADWSWNDAYFAQVVRRLQMWCGDRDGTEIIGVLDACSLYDGDSFNTNPLNKLATKGADVFSAGPARDKLIQFAGELVRRTAAFKDRIIWECVNEGTQIVGLDAYDDYTRTMIAALKAVGVPSSHIQVNWFDSSLFYNEINDTLGGSGLAATHRVLSPHDVSWYANSPGKQGLMKLGDYPSSDGASFGNDEKPPVLETTGYCFKWLIGTPAEAAVRRPSPDQIRSIMATMRGLGYGRYELLSASAFQTGNLPNLDDAISLGHAERIAMK